jgi:hypothetical protein
MPGWPTATKPNSVCFGFSKRYLLARLCLVYAPFEFQLLSASDAVDGSSTGT